MARPRSSVPRFCVDATGRAFCKVDGRFITLGRGDNPESRLRYAEVLLRVTKGLPLESVQQSVQRLGDPRLTVNELCLAFLAFASDEYRDAATGKPSAEYDCHKSAVKPLRELFGKTAAADFGPNALRTVREQYIAAGWSRGFINKAVGRIRHIWRWGVAREMVPASVLEGLRALEPLRAGKSSARETIKRSAVPADHIAAVRKRLRSRNRDLVDLLLLTGARPAEVLQLTTAMIQSRTSKDGVWIVPLTRHKTAHHGHERRLYFNAAAQAILSRYLRPDAPEVLLFPIQRKTLGSAIRDACGRAGVPVFTSHWLRHTAGTAIADGGDVEAAQRVLGHATISMTAHYSRAAEAKAVEAVKRLG